MTRRGGAYESGALLDQPDGPIRAVALFAHCVTCGKSNRAARHIAEGLKLHGIAVLHFDFTVHRTLKSEVDIRTVEAPAGHSQ